MTIDTIRTIIALALSVAGIALIIRDEKRRRANGSGSIDVKKYLKDFVKELPRALLGGIVLSLAAVWGLLLLFSGGVIGVAKYRSLMNGDLGRYLFYKSLEDDLWEDQTNYL